MDGRVLDSPLGKWSNFKAGDDWLRVRFYTGKGNAVCVLLSMARPKAYPSTGAVASWGTRVEIGASAGADISPNQFVGKISAEEGEGMSERQRKALAFGKAFSAYAEAKRSAIAKARRKALKRIDKEASRASKQMWALQKRAESLGLEGSP